ncbi:MAG: single-stranded DNA-binding protein [Magnetococcales bacterium]|nr:single-stranded DNA-binding protein [Magnetococcales bacterium]
MPNPVVPENRTVLEGVLLEPVAMRHSPTGRSTATLELEHRSVAMDIQPLERYELRIVVLAVGSLAETCRNLHPGASLRVTGRLNQRRWIRAGKVRWGRTELVAQGIESIAPTDDSGVRDPAVDSSEKGKIHE